MTYSKEFFQIRSLLNELTEAERMEIHKEVKKRLPSIPVKVKIVIVLYLLGCLFIFSGFNSLIYTALVDHRLEFHPEPEFFSDLLESIALLLRPFFAVWLIAMPSALIVGMFFWAREIFSKRL